MILTNLEAPLSVDIIAREAGVNASGRKGTVTLTVGRSGGAKIGHDQICP